MKIEQITKEFITQEYEVVFETHDEKLLPDEAVINKVDPGNFGGKVVRHPSGNLARVYIYTD